MEDIPESLLLDIFGRISEPSDKKSLSLVCRRFYEVDAQQRRALRIGCGLHPAAESLASLCRRFPNLSKIEINYSGWMYKFGKQLDDNGLLILSTHCPSLADLTLSFCSFITDAGLGHLSSCKDLSSLRLNFAPALSSNGLLSLSFGCKNLSTLCISLCMKVKSVEWLEHLGKMGRLEHLSIKNCRGIGDGDLMKLGPGWTKLKFLEFELDTKYRDSERFAASSAYRWESQYFHCEKLKELRLTNNFTSPLRGFSCLMGKCKVLEKLSLNMCVGLRDSDLILLAQNSSNLRSISLYLRTDMDNSSRLTDESLRALASGCPMLEEVVISFPLADFPSLLCFTQNGVITLIQSCPIRALVLEHAHFFNDTGMEALCSASLLESLKLVRCQEITDEGLQLIRHYPHLTKLTLCKCLGVTDDGLRPLVDLQKLESLTVTDCPQISEEGIHGIARFVSYKQDLSWLF